VTSKRTAGSVVKVVSLDSDSLRIESDGFQGTISVEKTDFWDRAEKTREAAINKQKGERLLAKERAIREAEERMKAERIKRYEAATILEIEITQVPDYGCLATVLNDNRKRIFLELAGPNFAQGQRYEVRAEQSWSFQVHNGTQCTVYDRTLDASGKALKLDPESCGIGPFLWSGLI
jgi:hypothetical protein